MARYRKVINWTVDSVMRVCHKNNLFTLREVEDFDFLVHCLHRFKPTDENIQTVAEMIYDKSDHCSIAGIMSLLASHAVYTYFEQIDDDEED